MATLRSPGLKVKLLVGPTGKMPRSTLRSVQGIRRSPKMCQEKICNTMANHPQRAARSRVCLLLDRSFPGKDLQELPPSLWELQWSNSNSATLQKQIPKKRVGLIESDRNPKKKSRIQTNHPYIIWVTWNPSYIS